MLEEEKKFFTDETICGRIKSDVADCFFACIFTTLGAALIFALIFIPIFVLMNNLFSNSGGVFAAKCVLIAILAGLLVFYCVKKIKKALELNKIIKNKAFTVHEDILERIAENEYNSMHGPSANRYTTVFYFCRFGRVVPDITTEYSVVGDKFYIVSYNCNSEKARFIYSAKIYDYKK